MIDKLEQEEFRVLARKYRPQIFEDLIGQETLVRTLTNAITNNRIAHAYLLTGVRGIGKTTTARLIAMSLNCEDRIQEKCEPWAEHPQADRAEAEREDSRREVDRAGPPGTPPC